MKWFAAVLMLSACGGAETVIQVVPPPSAEIVAHADGKTTYIYNWLSPCERRVTVENGVIIEDWHVQWPLTHYVKPFRECPKRSEDVTLPVWP